MDANNSKCSRCDGPIQCSVSTIENCRCNEIDLSDATRIFLNKTNYDCLCNDCLIAIDAKVMKAENMPEGMVEGDHYYKEDGLFVFTELYHINRGYCCGSGCRHCAYGTRIIKI